MAWIKSHQAVERHPKTLDLAAKMGWDVDTTIGKLHRFWWWCVDYAEDGDLRRHNDGLLGAAVALNGDDARKFVEAMVEARWLDREPYFRVHDWWDHAGSFLQTKYKKTPEKWQSVKDSYTSSSTSSSNGSCTAIDRERDKIDRERQDHPPSKQNGKDPPEHPGIKADREKADRLREAKRAAIEAFERWSNIRPPVGRGKPLHLEANEGSKIWNLVEKLEQCPPVARGNDLTYQHVLIPQAVDFLIDRKAEFKGIGYVCNAVKGELEEWARSGMKTGSNHSPKLHLHKNLD